MVQTQVLGTGDPNNEDLAFTAANNTQVDAMTNGYTETINGVVFGASSPNIAVATPGGGGTYGAAGASDNYMNGLVDTGVYSLGDLVITVSNLTAGASYQIDLLVANNQSTDRSQMVAVNNEAPGTYLINAVGGVYDLTENAVADTNGQITITATNNQGEGAVFGAVAVTTATPEPATMALLAIGGISALIRRRK
jgi:hypothetical protein